MTTAQQIRAAHEPALQRVLDELDEARAALWILNAAHEKTIAPVEREIARLEAEHRKLAAAVRACDTTSEN